jgi:hypothetical protein
LESSRVELSEIQRKGLRKHVDKLLNEARWHEDRLKKIARNLEEYGGLLNIEIDTNQWEIKKSDQ